MARREGRASSRAAQRPRKQPHSPEDGGALKCRRWGRASSRTAGDSDYTVFRRGRVLWGRASSRAAHAEKPEVRRDYRASSRAAGDNTAKQSW